MRARLVIAGLMICALALLPGSASAVVGGQPDASHPYVVMLADAVYEGLAGKQKDPTAAIWPDSGYHALNRAEPRPVVLAPFQALTDAAADCRIVAIQHADHDQFFSDVAEAMWSAVPSISPV